MLDLTKFAPDDTCGHCGTAYGWHQDTTDRCLLNGRLAPLGNAQQWADTTYIRADTLHLHKAAHELLELCRQQQTEIERLSAVNGVMVDAQYETVVADCYLRD